MTEAERLAQLTRLCVRCQETKTWADFYAHGRWPDGTMRRPQSLCRECQKQAWRERTAAQRAADPDAHRAKQREYHRRSRQRLQRDPEWRARRARLNAEWRRRAGMAKRDYAPRLVPVEMEGTELLLPIGPLRDWLERELRLLAEQHAGDERAAAGVLCARGDIDPRRLYAWRHDNKHVPLDRLDAFACAYGEPTLLADLYPDLYRFEDEAA